MTRQRTKVSSAAKLRCAIYHPYGPALTAGLDINKCSMKDVYYKFGLEAGTQDFVGHAMALWLDDE